MTISAAQLLQVAAPARAEVPGESATVLKPTHRGRVDRVKGWRPCVGPCREVKLRDLSAAQKAGGGYREPLAEHMCRMVDASRIHHTDDELQST